MLTAKIKAFRLDKFLKTTTTGKGTFLSPKETATEVNYEAYHGAIADFLTTLGPSRVIGIQTPGDWYRFGNNERTHIWYWEEA